MQLPRVTRGMGRNVGQWAPPETRPHGENVDFWETINKFEKELFMQVFILASLSACLLFSLVMACVQVIRIEKNILDLTALVEKRVTTLYKGDK